MTTPTIPANNQQTTTKVWVASFSPANDQNGVGGFWWDQDKDTITQIYIGEVKNSSHFGGSSIVRMLQATVNHDPDTQVDAVNDELNSRLDELEVTAVAERQYVPASTDPDRIPTGGVTRR